MSKAADTGEPAGQLERLIADLSGSGELIFVFGDGLTTAHLAGPAAPEFRGPAGRRWWHVRPGGDAASWTMSVRVDQITGVRFFRGAPVAGARHLEDVCDGPPRRNASHRLADQRAQPPNALPLKLRHRPMIR